MRLRTLSLVLIAGCLLLVGAAGEDSAIAQVPHERITLFNGRDLTGWYTWSRDNKFNDPQNVFSVVDGMLRISGEEWGGIATRQMYRDYHLIVEWKWAGPAHGGRSTKARDSGILVH